MASRQPEGRGRHLRFLESQLLAETWSRRENVLLWHSCKLLEECNLRCNNCNSISGWVRIHPQRTAHDTGGFYVVSRARRQPGRPWDIHPCILLSTHIHVTRGHAFFPQSHSLLQRPQKLKAGDLENNTVPTVYLELAGCVEPGKVVWGQGMLCDSPHFLLALSWLHSVPLMTFPQVQPKITNTF